MKKLKYLLFLTIIFISTNVFADNFNKIEIAYGYDRGTSTGIWSGYSTTLSHNFGTTDATIGYINTFNNIVTLNNQFQNGNFYSVNFTLQNDYYVYSSSFTLYDALQEMGHFNLKCSTSSSGSFLEPEQCFTNYNFRFQKTANDEVKAIITFTPLTNFTRLLVNITREGSPVGSQLISEYFAFSNFSYTMSTGGTGEIIDNQNQNTQDIINNNNNNTQEIIDNQNQNTQQQIDSQYICKNYDNSDVEISGQYLGRGGSIYYNDSFGITSYIPVYSSTRITNISTTTQIIFGCFYSSNKSLISCFNEKDLPLNSNISIPDDSAFVRFSIYRLLNVPTFKVCNNGNQAMNDYLTDDTDPNVDDNAINDVFGRVHFVDPLSYLLTLPTQLINQIVSMSDTCSTIDLGTLYGVHLTLPCINLENYLGSNLWSILDIILSVGLLSVIFKNFYDTISNLLTLGGEKEAKEKFSMPTPMDFLAMILGGDNK